ncbi:MAG: hypothetical protein HZA89_08260 [Verrucomicrobia bacterium]|nr:hypothetical protein [Verrucomicrobiota bacterium]
MKLSFVIAGLLAILASGCRTSYTRQCGDAKLHKERVHIALLAGPDTIYRLDLPSVDLTKARTNNFRVRGLNARIFLPSIELHMTLPEKDCTAKWNGGERAPGVVLPWEDVVLTLLVRETNNTLVASERRRLGDLKWKFTRGNGFFLWHANSEIKLALQPPANGTDFNVEAVVEKASARNSDRIQISCTGYDYKSWP